MSKGEECRQSVLSALKAGYRLIATAEAYGNEEEIGNAVLESGISRKDLFIVTKVNFRSYENVREIVSKSLSNLKTDYLDLVLLHWPFGNYYAAYRELEKLYEEGVIKAIGVSNFDSGRLIDLIEFNKVVPAVNQIETNLYCQRKEEHAYMEKYRVAHMSYAPLGQGRRKEMFAEPRLIEIAERHGKTPAQVMLRYLMQNDIVIIPKSLHEERIRGNFDIFNFSLGEQEMEVLGALDRNEALIGNNNDPSKVEMTMKW